MKRTTSLIDYRNTGALVLDADGVPVNVGAILARLSSLDADTGWRSIPTLSGVAAGAAWIKRTGPWVEMELRDITAAVTGHLIVAAIANGFTPKILSATSTRSGVVVTDTGATRSASFYQGNMRVLSASASDAYSGRLIWSTSDAWPAPLPGTPA